MADQEKNMHLRGERVEDVPKGKGRDQIGGRGEEGKLGTFAGWYNGWPE